VGVRSEDESQTTRESEKGSTMSHRKNMKKYKGVTKHEKPAPPAHAAPKRDPNRRKRKVLQALKAGVKLLYDKRHAYWMLMHENGKRERVKARVVEYLQGILLIAYNKTLGRWGLTRGGECAIAAL
jgi:hypothetical protein